MNVVDLAVRVLASILWLLPNVAWDTTYLGTAIAFASAAEADPFTGKSGPDPMLTASVLVWWAHQESRFRSALVGDHGHSVGLLQINPEYAAAFLKRPVDEVRAELFDPTTAAPIWLALAHESFRMCRKRPVDERLAQLAWGPDCDHRLELSRSRMKKARSLAEVF